MAKINDFSWAFQVKDAGATRHNHKERIKKIKHFNIGFHNGIDRFADDMIVGAILRSGWWKYNYHNKPQKLTKTLVKTIKNVVNNTTRGHIRKNLKGAGYPVSWDTAFYMVHKTRVDALMKKIAKKLVGYAKGGY